MSPESKPANQGILTEIRRIGVQIGPNMDDVAYHHFELILDTGIKITLPPEAQGVTIQHLQVGDSFSITTPWEQVIEGAPQLNEDASEITVMRENQRVLGFVIKSDMVRKQMSIGEAAQKVASNLAAAILKETLKKGNSIEIPSLGIKINPDGTTKKL